MKDDKRLADRLRRGLNMPYHLDEEILGCTKGTFLRARIELGLALDDLWAAARKDLYLDRVVEFLSKLFNRR